MPTATKEKVTFLSTSPNLRVIFKPRRERLLQDGAGNVVGRPQVDIKDLPEQEWIRAHNEQPETDSIDVEALPVAADFKNWQYETDDENVIAALRAHPNNGKELTGFHERFANAEERLAEVAQLTAEGDLDGLRNLLETEKRQGNHAAVLESGRRALAALDTEVEPEGDTEGETAEAGSTDDSTEPRDGSPSGQG